MDFKSFAKSKGDAKNKNNADLNGRTVDDIVNDYSGKSSEQLMSDIIAEAGRQKAAGNLSDADLEKFYSTIAPMLNREQLKKLQSILKIIK